MFSSTMRRLRQASVFAVLAFGLGTAAAQSSISFSTNQAAFEGNGGTRLMRFQGSVTPPSTQPFSGRLSLLPLSGNGFVAATGGAACGPGIDFVQVDVPFSLPANTATIFTDVVICGDTTIEPNERFVVALTQLVGATCTIESCSAIGTIRNDDGPPSVLIRNASATEPLFGSRTMSFTVELSHPTGSNTSVNFAMRNGTARASTSCIRPLPDGSPPDYVLRSGVLTIPADTPSGSIDINICADSVNERDETFFVDLSNPSPVGVTISRSTAQGTIRNAGFVGEFALSPQDSEVGVGDVANYEVLWTVPQGEVWRDLRTIDLRIGRGSKALWVRWEEAGNTFSLCSKGDGDDDGADDTGADWHSAGLPCGPGALPGSDVVLQTPLARLDLAHSSVTGSGPTGRSVTLKLNIAFAAKAAGHTYPVELAATDDFGQRDDFRLAGTVQVRRGVLPP